MIVSMAVAFVASMVFHNVGVFTAMFRHSFETCDMLKGAFLFMDRRELVLELITASNMRARTSLGRRYIGSR